MAGATSRTILVCAFPAVITLLTFLWVRKKKKQQQSLLEDSIVKTSSAISNQSPPIIGNSEERQNNLTNINTMREKKPSPDDNKLSATSKLEVDKNADSSFSDDVETARNDEREESEILVNKRDSTSENTSISSPDALVTEFSNMRIEISKELEHCSPEELVVDEHSETLTRLSYSSTSSSTSDAYLVTEDKIHRHRDCPFELDNVPEMSPPPSLYSDAHSEVNFHHFLA